jgi:hypothetical protein
MAQQEEVLEEAQQKEVMQAQSVDIATVEPMVRPFLESYCTIVDAVGMVVPQEQPKEEEDASDNIEALFGYSDSDAIAPTMTD